MSWTTERRKLLMLSAAIMLVGFGCQRAAPESEIVSPEIDRQQILSEARKNGLIMDAEETARMFDPSVLQTITGKSAANLEAALKIDTSKWTSAALADVTGGGSFGLAFITYQNNKTTIIAKMGNLPVLQEGELFTGWMVKRGKEMQVVNLGEATLVGDQYVLMFETSVDLSDYNFFVLTQAQTHILEGSFR